MTEYIDQFREEKEELRKKLQRKFHVGRKVEISDNALAQILGYSKQQFSNFANPEFNRGEQELKDAIATIKKLNKLLCNEILPKVQSDQGLKSHNIDRRKLMKYLLGGVLGVGVIGASLRYENAGLKNDFEIYKAWFTTLTTPKEKDKEKFEPYEEVMAPIMSLIKRKSIFLKLLETNLVNKESDLFYHSDLDESLFEDNTNRVLIKHPDGNLVYAFDIGVCSYTPHKKLSLDDDKTRIVNFFTIINDNIQNIIFKNKNTKVVSIESRLNNWLKLDLTKSKIVPTLFYVLYFENGAASNNDDNQYKNMNIYGNGIMYRYPAYLNKGKDAASTRVSTKVCH